MMVLESVTTPAATVGEPYSFNLRGLQTKIPKEELDMASHLFEMLREIRESLAGSP